MTLPNHLPPPPGLPGQILTPESGGVAPPLPPGGYYPDGTETDITGGLPINLDSLRDGPPGSKPFYPYSTLIRYAIKGSPTGKLLLEDIYYAIESRFPYFRSAPAGWKNSVRHNLSLNPCFEKVARPLTDRGKGSYWTVNDNVDPRTGVHRIRKKKSKKSDHAQNAVREEENVGEYQQHQQQQSQQSQPPQAFEGTHAQYVQPPPPMDPSPPGPSRPGPPYPPPFPGSGFDGSFPMMPPPGMHYPAPFRPSEDAAVEFDEQGNVNWRLAWMRELEHLLRSSAEPENAPTDSEWFRVMLLRVRAAVATPVYPGEALPPNGPPHGMGGPHGEGVSQEHHDEQ